jgi:branched-chain amino acid transport system ATP-binding protein
MSLESLLNLEHINAGYSSVQILWDINLELGPKDFIAIIGPNGAGKTTLFRVITGVIKPDSGRVIFAGRDITRMPPHKISKLGISGVAEGRRIFPHMSVKENLELGFYASTRRDRKILEERLRQVFSLFPRLKERAAQRAGSLSGGEQQMLAIGRALMGDPKLLILDEPSIGLAPSLVEQVYESVAKLKSEIGIAVLVLEQDVERLPANVDKIYYIEEGRIHGPARASSNATVIYCSKRLGGSQLR